MSSILSAVYRANVIMDKEILIEENKPVNIILDNGCIEECKVDELKGKKIHLPIKPFDIKNCSKNYKLYIKLGYICMMTMDLKEEIKYEINWKIINDVNFKLKLPKKKTEIRELFLNEPFLPGQENITKAINTDKASALLNLKDFNDIINFDVDLDEYYRGIMCGILTACFYIKPGKYISSKFPQIIDLNIFLKDKIQTKAYRCDYNSNCNNINISDCYKCEICNKFMCKECFEKYTNKTKKYCLKNHNLEKLISKDSIKYDDLNILDNISNLCTTLEFNSYNIFISDIKNIKNLIKNIGIYNDNDMKNLVDLYNSKQPKVLKLIKTHANKELYLKFVDLTTDKKSILIN
jgi:hypothetical protein